MQSNFSDQEIEAIRKRIEDGLVFGGLPRRWAKIALGEEMIPLTKPNYPPHLPVFASIITDDGKKHPMKLHESVEKGKFFYGDPHCGYLFKETNQGIQLIVEDPKHPFFGKFLKHGTKDEYKQLLVDVFGSWEAEVW